MKRAAVYARYSTEKQDESSIHDQVRVCKEYAERHGMQVVTEFKDEGISGAAIGNRPGYLALMDAAKRKQLDALLVMDLSRLSRSQADLTKSIDKLRFMGCEIVGVQDGYDSSRKGHKMQAGLSGIIGEAFREMVADRTYAALESRAKSKRAVGSCPYGYQPVTRDDGSKWLEIVPDEATVVQRIFTMYADGLGGKQIAHALNDDSIASPAKHWQRTVRRADGNWHPSAIVGDPTKHVGILNNETYTGKLIWNRSKWTKDPDSGKRRRTTLPRSQWIIGDAPDLAIVGAVLWRRVQDRIAATQARTKQARERAAKLVDQQLPAHRTRGGYKDADNARPGHSRYVLSGLLKCGVCGSNYAMADGRKYACATRTNCGPAGCSNDQRVSRTDAERELFAALREELTNGEYLKLWTAEVERSLREQRQSPTADNTLRKQLAEAETKVGRLVDAIASGLKGSDAVATRLREAEAECGQLKARLEALAVPVPVNFGSSLLAAAAEFSQMVAELPDHLNDPETVTEAREALRDWLREIRIEPTDDGPLAFWRINDEGLLRSAGPHCGQNGSGGRI